MSATQQVITIDDISAENAPVIYVAGGLNQFLDAVKAKVTSEVPDLTTAKGRARIASLANTVSKSKAAVEKPGRDYLKRLKEMPKVVEAELREFVIGMDALRDATRQPLTDWEKAEEARVEFHNSMIRHIEDCGAGLIGGQPQPFALLFRELEEKIVIDEKFEEFEADAHRAKANALVKLKTAFEEHQQREAEQAELERLREEAAARAKADHEAAIAKAAAEQAQREADERAAAERAEAARREQALIDQAAAQKRQAEQAASDAAAEVERQRLQIQLQAEQSARALEQAEANRIAAEQRAEQERIAAEQRQAAAVERARLAEIARQEQVAAEEKRLAAAREADKAHKGAIYKAAKEAFMDNGMTEDCARLAVKLIASGFIPAVKIEY